MTKLRTLVPKPLQPAARRIYLQVGPATSRLRMEPSFMVIGGQRCGTTSIFKALSDHPQVARPPVEKGTDYFTLNYARSLDWYRGHFPVARPAWSTTGVHRDPVAFEACTYYLFHPLALQRIAEAYPRMKLVAMLRDPVERAFSAYKHEFGRGFETEPDFERALALEDERLEGEVDKIRADVGYESIPHRHHAYRRRGQYAEQLQRAYDLFPVEQIYVMESESFFVEPEREYTALTDFLGLRRFVPPSFDQHNARPSSPMPEGAKTTLQAHYGPYDEALTQLLGRPPRWLG